MSQRANARVRIAGMLQTALVGTGKPAQAVYSYQVSDFGGQSPVVVVWSGSTLPKQMTARFTERQHWINVMIFSLYADGTWTEADAENAVDDIAEKIYDTLDNNQVSPDWNAIACEQSEPGSVEIGGAEYRTELIRVRIS